jgi:hypothetical protein
MFEQEMNMEKKELLIIPLLLIRRLGALWAWLSHHRHYRPLVSRRIAIANQSVPTARPVSTGVLSYCNPTCVNLYARLGAVAPLK